MDHISADEGWRQLQANIESFLGQSLRSDGRRVEYRPKFISPLPGMYDEQTRGERAPACPNPASRIAGKKGGSSNAQRTGSRGL
jgi:hypothetical protein